MLRAAENNCWSDLQPGAKAAEGGISNVSGLSESLAKGLVKRAWNIFLVDMMRALLSNSVSGIVKAPLAQYRCLPVVGGLADLPKQVIRDRLEACLTQAYEDLPGPDSPGPWHCRQSCVGMRRVGCLSQQEHLVQLLQLGKGGSPRCGLKQRSKFPRRFVGVPPEPHELATDEGHRITPGRLADRHLHLLRVQERHRGGTNAAELAFKVWSPIAPAIIVTSSLYFPVARSISHNEPPSLESQATSVCPCAILTGCDDLDQDPQ